MGIDLEQPSTGLPSRSQVDGCIVDGGGIGHGHDGGNVNPLVVANGSLITGASAGGNQSDARQKIQGDELNTNFLKCKEPHDGIEFESKEEAFSYYKDYAEAVGFTALIKASRRSRTSGKFIDAKFCCTRYGSRPESKRDAAQELASTSENTMSPVQKKRGRTNRSWLKTDCKASMHVKRRPDGRWTVSSFVKEHNHEIFPGQAVYFKGDGNSDLANRGREALHAVWARANSMYTSVVRRLDGHGKPHNQKRHCTKQLESDLHLRLDEGDARAMLDHFLFMQDENPNFFYAIDLNQGQRLRNVFWVDAKGRLDYEYFGDVVFFDTKYIKDEYKLPFAPFIGVNNHFQPLLLGCALLVDDTKSTYIWLMRAWLKAMGGCAPQVILTDQEGSLKEAIVEVLPGSRHCFCLWHILSKVPEKLPNVIRHNENFMKKFNKCILKSCTIEQFEERWTKVVGRFNLVNDPWFQSLYEDRERWAPTYIRDICLVGMSTVQRSDSVSSLFGKLIQRKTNLKEFLEKYSAVLQETYEEETKSDFETWHKHPVLKSPSPFGKQMAALYTHAIFKKFQIEVLGVVACHPRKGSEVGTIKTFRVQDFEDSRDLIVVRDETTSDISCSCHFFEFNGFLCRHVMIVLQMAGVNTIPSQYVLKRWTKDAKSREFMRKIPAVLESKAQRYNDLCKQALKLGDEGSLSQDSYNIALNALEEALRKCEDLNNSSQYMVAPSSPPSHGSHDFEKFDHDRRNRGTDKTEHSN